MSLIQRQIAPPVEAPTGFYADLTRRYLRGELERTGSILDFRLSEEESEAFAESLCREYGTDDVVEIIDRLRDCGHTSSESRSCWRSPRSSGWNGLLKSREN